MSPQLIVLCHVEPGTVRGHTILPSFERTEGIVRALPLVLEFADRLRLPMGVALSPQALPFVDIDMAGHDAGVHLHPLDPVLVERLAGRLKPSLDCLGRYVPAEQALLIAGARTAFEDRMGRSPRLFVSGRWSEDATTAALLRKEGFTHDGSVLPGYRSACADWSRIPRLANPYAPAAEDPQARGSEPYVYLPVYQGHWGHHLTPETVLDLGVSYMKAAFHEAQTGGAEVVHIYFHSPLALDPEAMAAFAEVLEYARDVLHFPFVRPTTLRPSAVPRSRPFAPAYWSRIDRTFLKSVVGRTELARRIKGVGPLRKDWDGMSPSGGAEDAARDAPDERFPMP